MSRRNLRSGLLLALLVPVLVYSFSSGPPSGVTGGFGERTCNQSGCHVGTGVNAGPGNVTITAPDSYTSGGTFTITVTVSDPNQRRWGFELSARTQDGKQAGTLRVGSDGFTQLLPPLSGIQYISHTIPGTRVGTTAGASFRFTWQAPDVSAGPVVFNAAGNAANGDFDHTGDRIYTTMVTVPPQAVSGPVPAVNDLGTVNNASFASGTAPLAVGTIAAIFGTNLNDGSNTAFSSFGEDGKLLSTLAGASVTFNGISAPLFSAFPSQLNVQIPFELADATTASVVVTVGGQSGPPRTVFLGPVSPGIFSTSQDGKGQGAVLIANTEILAAPAGSIPGRTTRPARPGEFISIFSTGLGQVNPPVATGARATSNATVATPTVTIDGVPVPVQFSGMAPGFVALNQINVQVPQGTRTANDIPVVVAVGETRSNTVTIAVAP